MRTLTRTSVQWLAEVYVPRAPAPHDEQTPGSDRATLLRHGAVMVVGIVVVVGVWAVTGEVLPA